MAMTQPNSYSTHAIEYTITTRPIPYRKRMNPSASLRRCTLARAAVGSVADMEPLRIPCFNCFDSPNIADYVKRYKQQLIILLHNYFPFISNCCAYTVADTFASTVLLPANAAHNCPYRPLHGINVVTRYSLHQVHIMVHDQEEEEEEGSLDEEDGVRAGPASPAAVRALIQGKIVEDFKERDMPWNVVDRECAICMEVMETRMSSLKMPCSHVFHRSCLVQWLNKGSTCPLCRYQMPSLIDRN